VSATQIALTVAAIVAAVIAGGLISWGLSGVLTGSGRPSGSKPTDRAAELERKNLAAKRNHNSG